MDMGDSDTMTTTWYAKRTHVVQAPFTESLKGLTHTPNLCTSLASCEIQRLLRHYANSPSNQQRIQARVLQVTLTHEARPMTNPTSMVSGVFQGITVCLLAGALFAEGGCVSQRAYDRIKAETQEHTRALESVRDEVKELDQQIAGLQAANRHEDASTTELRAAVQREEEQLPVMRQRAEAVLTSLKGQVAALMNQSWSLARKIADLRHESASLQTAAAQYKQEREEGQAPVTVVAEEEESSITPAMTAELSTPSESPTLEPVVAQLPAPTAASPSLSASAPSIPSPSMNAEPPETDNSWIGMIFSWLTTLWNWLLS